MNYIKHQTGLFERFAEDKLINPFHISLYFALFQFWNRNRFRNPFPVSREELMFLAHIGSVNTYTRCIKELHQWGYIEYFPSFNPNTGSKVTCISFDKGSDKADSKADDKGSGKGGDNAADKALYKNTNITNGIKQAHSQNLKNGREKIKRNNPLHANTDKDYSEPFLCCNPNFSFNIFQYISYLMFWLISLSGNTEPEGFLFLAKLYRGRSPA